MKRGNDESGFGDFILNAVERAASDRAQGSSATLAAACIDARGVAMRLVAGRKLQSSSTSRAPRAREQQAIMRSFEQRSLRVSTTSR